MTNEIRWFLRLVVSCERWFACSYHYVISACFYIARSLGFISHVVWYLGLAPLFIISGVFLLGKGGYLLVKNANEISRILPDLICKNIRFSACFEFWADSTVTIFRENGTMAHILMVKPIRALELHYPMIRFVIRWCSFIISAMFFWLF